MLTALIVLRTLVVAASALVVHHRVRRTAVSRDTWRAYRTGLLVLAACSAVETVLLVSGRAVGVVGLPAVVVLRVGSSVGCYLLFHGLALWYRARESATPAGRVDWLVGVSSVCGVVGLGNLLVDVPAGWAVGLAPQLRLLHVGTLVVLLVAVACAALALPAPVRRRSSLVAVAVLLVVLTQAGFLALGTVPAAVAAWCAWMVLAASYAVLALLSPPVVGRSRPLPLSVPLVGSLVLGLGLVAVVGAGVQTASNHWALLWGSLAIAGSGARLVRLIRDLADHDRARRQAGTDDLTGLANRREFLRRLQIACAGTGPVGVVLLDLDRFKEVNDRWGHGSGDDVLADTAVELLAVTPPGAVLARVGGDEFALVLTGADVDRAVEVARTATDAVARRRPAAPVSSVLTASAGVATSTGLPGLDAAELLRRADGAVHAAKHSGAGVAAHDDDAHRAWHDRVVLAEELLAVLGPDAPAGAAEEFCVHYQPQVGLGTDEVVGVEALVRWNHPRLGLLAPGAFLDVVEERGLMPALTLHVARRSVADLSSWRARGVDLRLSINTSGSYLSDPDLLVLLDELVATGTDPSRLVVEVTETTLMDDPDRALATCLDITARGCALSIDDFGTGYSSLAYLATLPATELKVDRSFTARLLTDERTAAIVAGTVQLAHHLGLRVVAEGVEDAATLERLRALGCDESQGYLHSRPLPAEGFLRWLGQRGSSAPVVGAALADQS